MKSTLWVPCYNEGTQLTEFVTDAGEIFSGEKKVALDALELLNPLLQSGLFSEIIVTDDGSQDDTREMLHFFRERHGYSERVFRILAHEDNGGKMLRFIEAFEKSDTDVFVMTDADIVHVSGDAFTKLATSEPRSTMLASWMGEYNPKHHSYVPYVSSTGTRSLVARRAQKIFGQHQISSRWQPGRGYGLEVMLNKLFCFSELTTTVNHAQGDIPLFLSPMRKDRNRQLDDIQQTEQQMIDLLAK